jgi:hypothetical protein
MTDGLITSHIEFQSALRQAFAEAAAAGSRELWLADSDFADWPLGERDVVECLAQWAASSRRLTLLANTFGEVARRHPRWVAWRRQWAHVVSCRINSELEESAVPTILIASGTLSVRLSDRVHHRGRISHDKAEELRCTELFDAVLQRSEEAFPASATGL